MTEDTLPADDMKYSFKAHVQVHGFAGDLIISSTTVNDLVKSINLLERAGITPTTSTQKAAATPVCPPSINSLSSPASALVASTALRK